MQSILVIVVEPASIIPPFLHEIDISIGNKAISVVILVTDSYKTLSLLNDFLKFCFTLIDSWVSFVNPSILKITQLLRSRCARAYRPDTGTHLSLPCRKCVGVSRRLHRRRALAGIAGLHLGGQYFFTHQLPDSYTVDEHFKSVF